MQPVTKLASVLKILLGAVFIFSAVSKYVTIDSFEIYVYSFGLFPLVMCFYLSRLLIAAELLLGIALISHRNHRFTSITSLLFLLFFVGFLVYAHLIGRTDNCHCFGDLLPFNPVQSILKNAVMIVVLLFIYKYSAQDWHPRWWLVLIIYLLVAVLFGVYSYFVLHALNLLSIVLILVAMAIGILASMPFYSRWWITAPLLIAPFIATFILTPPDSWFFKEGDVRYDKDLFISTFVNNDSDDAISDTTQVALALPSLNKSCKLVAFFSPSCSFCRLAAEKVSTIASRNDIDKNKVVYVFPDGYEQNRYDDFYERANSAKFSEIRINRDLFVQITRAAFPVILLVNDGEVVAAYDYRAINEQQITNLLSK